MDRTHENRASDPNEHLPAVYTEATPPRVALIVDARKGLGWLAYDHQCAQESSGWKNTVLARGEVDTYQATRRKYRGVASMEYV